MGLLLAAVVAASSGCTDVGGSLGIRADAGPDQVVEVESLVLLDGGGEADGGCCDAYSWSFVRRAPGSDAALGDAGSARASFVADVVGEYEIALTVTLGERSASDTLIVVAETSFAGFLEGDPDLLARLATRDVDLRIDHPEEAFVPDPAVGELTVVLTREVELAFALDATVGEVNVLLERYEARIVSMLAGVPIVVLEVPEPGGLSGLEALLASLRSEPGVVFVNRSVVVEDVELDPEPTDPTVAGSTRTVAPSRVPERAADLDETRLGRIDHHLSVRAHAAWNASTASTDTVPWLLVGDSFGDGTPRDGYDGTFEDDDFAVTTDRTRRHGYHVLGIMLGTFDPGDEVSSDDRADVTGIVPFGLPVRAIDSRDFRTWPRFNNRLIAVINEVLDEDPDARIVLNTSRNTRSLGADQSPEAISWIARVRMAGETFPRLGTVGAGLEERFVHLTTAGNTPVVAPPWAAVDNSMWAHAALATNLSGFGISIPALTNTLVVENRRRTRHAADATDRPRPLCADSRSIMGGTISAIGVGVWSMGTAGSQDDAQGASNANGTSMASPQVAGLAAYAWSIAPDLSVPEIVDLLLATALADTPANTAANCSATLPQPVIDAYATILAAGGDDAWRAILDVNDDGVFDHDDVRLFLNAFAQRDARYDYGRFDLNGDGTTGNLDRSERVDLDGDGDHGSVVRTLSGLGVSRTFDESAVSDYDVLCAQAFSGLFQGLASQRTALLGEVCAGVVVRIVEPAVQQELLGTNATLRADLFDSSAPDAALPDPGDVTIRWSQVLADGRTIPLGTTLPGAALSTSLVCADARVRAEAWRGSQRLGTDSVRFEFLQARPAPWVAEMVSPTGGVSYLSSALADNSRDLQGRALRARCEGPETRLASLLVWRNDATGALLATGPTLTVSVGDLGANGTTFRLESGAGGTPALHRVVPCSPFDSLAINVGLRACSEGALRERIADVVDNRFRDVIAAQEAREDLENALREQFVNAVPSPFPLQGAALEEAVAERTGSFQSLSFLQLLAYVLEFDPSAFREELLSFEQQASTNLGGSGDEEVLKLFLATTELASAVFDRLAPPELGGEGGWQAYAFATEEQQTAADLAPPVRAAVEGFLSGFVDSYEGPLLGAGFGAYDVELSVEAGAIVAALAALDELERVGAR